jgi:hypothetical protein
MCKNRLNYRWIYIAEVNDRYLSSYLSAHRSFLAPYYKNRKILVGPCHWPMVASDRLSHRKQSQPPETRALSGALSYLLCHEHWDAVPVEGSVEVPFVVLTGSTTLGINSFLFCFISGCFP